MPGYFFFIAFVGFENTQIVKGAVSSVSDLDWVLKSAWAEDKQKNGCRIVVTCWHGRQS